MRNAKVFAGSSHMDLAQAIVDKLGIATAPLSIKLHANHEISTDIGISVRNEDIFIIQSGSESINDSLMELLILINACRVSSAARITAILPYFPYAKQSKKKKARGTVTAKLVANMLAVAGLDHIITVDLHNEQMQGFFTKPVDNLLAEPTLCKYISERIPNYRSAVAVSKNPGGVKRVTSLADRLKIDFALIHQDKSVPKPIKASRNTESITSGQHMVAFTAPSVQTTTEMVPDHLAEQPEDIGSLQVVEVYTPQWHEEGLQLVGDVADRPCFLVDDILDKPDGFISAARLLKRRGATEVYVVATHGLLSGDALDEFEECDAVHQVIVTNSYPIPIEKQRTSTKLQIIDMSGVLAEAIRRTHNGESISYLFHTAL
ncbi:ribose-phosphate pyrophosphokinase 1-like protein [Catenaria anguillulae PL171]|uniref:ribose-phosphate diphosphokinase n=1 Tax=Catenaria anguillulae PL171 TaxID=765915 RepID=A0A1Y2HSN4_9FUNG|nr:ribose-phosphate pyrophosphokinase 1-like protein [Catenaria anguillulae PL171]